MGQSEYECMMPRMIISGLAGGGGKTLLSLGLCRAFAEDGVQVKPFKKGPDYIDAAWLGQAAGRECSNLDPFFLDEQRLRNLFGHASAGADLAVIEGNRGLYDGRDAQGSCSTAALARTLDAPVILSMNCTKMTRTAAAIAVGMAGFEQFRFAGVVLNQVGTGRHENLVRRCMEDAGIRVLGALPRLRENPVPERHMGLIGPDNQELVERSLKTIAQVVRDHVDMEAVREAARVPALGCSAFWEGEKQAAQVRIGYVRDAALWFYYPENLEALERAGAELVRVSLFDAEPWPHLDGLYLGGGFPELMGTALAASERVADLRELSRRNMPVYAECGGFIILCRELRVGDETFPMAGVFEAKAVFERRPQGLGYVEATVEKENPFYPLGMVFRGHEFHYSRCAQTDGATVLTLDHGVGMGEGRDGVCTGKTFAVYTHVFAPAVPRWAENFVCAAREFLRNGNPAAEI